MNFALNAVEFLIYLTIFSISICYVWIGENISKNPLANFVFGIIFLAVGIHLPVIYPEFTFNYTAVFGVFCFASGLKLIGIFITGRIFFHNKKTPSSIIKPPYDARYICKKNWPEVMPWIKYSITNKKYAKKYSKKAKHNQNIHISIFGALRKSFYRYSYRPHNQQKWTKNRGKIKQNQCCGVFPPGRNNIIHLPREKKMQTRFQVRYE